MENVRDRRQRDRNPITGVGMTDKDTRDTMSNFHGRKRHSLPESSSSNSLGLDMDADVDKTIPKLKEEQSSYSAALETEDCVDDLTETQREKEEPYTALSSLTLDDDNKTPEKMQEQELMPEVSTPTAAQLSRRRQRERNPITGVGMMEQDYRATVPSFKTHGPQRKEGNPINYEGYSRDDSAYQATVKEASISPLTRRENNSPIMKQSESAVEASPDSNTLSTPTSRQRRRDRNPITGYGMEERDFRVQIPTFKIHGPQRRSGDPLTGTGYETRDKEYNRRVQKACDSPLSTAKSGDSVNRR